MKHTEVLSLLKELSPSSLFIYIVTAILVAPTCIKRIRLTITAAVEFWEDDSTRKFYSLIQSAVLSFGSLLRTILLPDDHKQEKSSPDLSNAIQIIANCVGVITGYALSICCIFLVLIFGYAVVLEFSQKAYWYTFLAYAMMLLSMLYIRNFWVLGGNSWIDLKDDLNFK